MSEVIRKACRGRANCTVRIYGQMVDILWKDGQQEAAIRLEMLWNQLANAKAFSLMCGYAMGNFYKDANFDEIAATTRTLFTRWGGRGCCISAS
ncbi:MAG: hypothetical protein ACREX9_00365 [Gammaproteobacteria bacterium]